MSMTAPVPGPRPGYESPEPVSFHDKAALVATAARALIGVMCLAVAVLYLPAAFVTPILSGVSVMMLVTGAYASWQVARREPRLRSYARMVWWGCPALGLLIFALMLILGPGSFGPDWAGTFTPEVQQPATFVPAD
jgi:hypothetical protein